MCPPWIDELIFLQMKVTQKESLRAWPVTSQCMNGCGGFTSEATWGEVYH